MARRRFTRSKTSPEMGWIVGTSKLSIVHQSSGDPENTSVFFLFDFADVDPEALTGRIEKDKSDWFVKRVVLDWAASYATTELGPTDVARRWQFALGTIGIEDSQNMSTNNFPIIGPEAYNSWARLFRTWEQSVYAAGLIPYATEDASGNTGVAEVNLADVANVPAGYSVTAPFWGESGGHADFEISNAGLRNNQGVAIALGTTEGPSAGFDWGADEVLYVKFTYRFLLQKRR